MLGFSDRQLTWHGHWSDEQTEIVLAATLSEAAQRLNSQKPGNGWPALVMVTDAARLPDPVAAAAQMPRGSAVLLRDYQHPDRVALAQSLRQVCRARGLEFWVAGDVGLALLVAADGIHFPEQQVRHSGAWRRPKPNMRMTAAVHSKPALVRAATACVDAVFLSPVFETASHPGARTLGAVRFAGLVRESRLPVYALGGITTGSARRLYQSGAVGLAAISAFR